MQTKICTKCGIEKKISEFYKYPNGKFGVRADCKKCQLLYAHEYYFKNWDEKRKINNKYKSEHKEQNKNSILKRKFGITLDQYKEMFEKQNGLCAICNKEEKVNGRSLAVDHNHKTGKVRGLLCNKCNHHVLSGANDNINILQSAINYLNLYKD
jgi:Recombination endonuclease VII